MGRCRPKKTPSDSDSLTLPVGADAELRSNDPGFVGSFPTSRETMEFEETALRPHRVFQAGQWVLDAQAVLVSQLKWAV
jgi:hypothetical protein